MVQLTVVIGWYIYICTGRVNVSLVFCQMSVIRSVLLSRSKSYEASFFCQSPGHKMHLDGHMNLEALKGNTRS